MLGRIRLLRGVGQTQPVRAEQGLDEEELQGDMQVWMQEPRPGLQGYVHCITLVLYMTCPNWSRLVLNSPTENSLQECNFTLKI